MRDSLSTSLSDSNIYDFTVNRLDNTLCTLGEYRGKVLLIVNTASACGFTPQYQGLENLYQQYREKGLEILAFPCNQFGAQEPGTAEEISVFCEKNYGVTFPLFAKIDVNGQHAAPLYTYLKDAQSGLLGTQAIKWNFTKFLINKEGQVVERYAPITKPEALVTAIEKLLTY